MPILNYQICSRCVMDTSDPGITFDEAGVCNHCHDHDEALGKQVFSGEDGRRRLDQIIERIKREGVGKAYDCIIGVSGGVDSTYTAWQVKELGLRPLAVHLDNGWNSEIAVKNIANALERLNIDLYTHVIDWEEYRDIQRAFLLASVADVEIPSDHAILACLYQTAAKHGIKTIISGNNIRTESHLPPSWSQGHLDYGYIKDIHTRFGNGRVKTFPRLSFYQYLTHVRSGQKPFDVLNYVDYGRDQALELIQRELGWRDYGGKHHESVFTRWYQGCYLPRKFGFDKRRTHLSSLVSTDQITRQQALAELQPPPYDEKLQDADCAYVAKKLGFSTVEFDAIMTAAPAYFDDFHSYRKALNSGLLKTARQARSAFLRLTSRDRVGV
ncbi:N-acetyl sugar amidotransferase [Sulfuriferula sp.]|uniref:N-acetyl sugar amidotransferase n=1 Tax=Sulfuriferula sp. TaxID=2025307 RepID=UPI0027315DD1|nr:N-acetyl sugar amidotransferase [Sulfuriferula sp.]MDP2024887.1 N-acetyl sugar amidotransferase [Sulfuriferula sp.]